jgi:hypothetical protein
MAKKIGLLKSFALAKPKNIKSKDTVSPAKKAMAKLKASAKKIVN